MAPEVRVEQFDSIAAEWEQLLPSCSTNTPFVTPWWQRTWWRNFGREDELRLLSVRDNGAVLGIAPLMLVDGVLSFLGGSDLFDYHDFLVPRGNELSFYSTLFSYLSSLNWHTFDMMSVPEGSPSLRYVPEMAEQRGYASAVREEDKTPTACLPSTWDEYMASLSKKNRHEVRRKLRRLESAGDSRQYVCDSPEALLQGMQEFFKLHRASRPEKAKFLTAPREKFFIDIAVELGARGQFRLAFLELDGVKVAACINFEYLDSYLLYNSGYDPSYAKLSVGLLNKVLAIKEAIEAGKLTFDFLRGAERYKYDLGAEDRGVYHLSVSR